MLRDRDNRGEIGADGSDTLPYAKTALLTTGPALLAIGLYIGALKGGFVWDDYVLADGTGIGGGRSLGACFRTAFLDHFYRPLVSVSFLMDRHLWPDNPAAYHLVNIVLHGLGTAVVVLLAREVLGSRGIAVLAGTLFALHPVHVGAVAWIGGRTDALGCLWTGLFLLGLVGAARRTGSDRSLWLAGSVVAYAIAVFTKEQSLFLLPLVPLAFVAFRPERGVSLPREGAYALAPYAVVAAWYLAIGAFLGMPGPAPMGASVTEQAKRFFLATFGYAELLLVPNQRVMHTFSLEPWARAGSWAIAAGLVLAAGSLALFGIWMQRDRRMAWLLAAVVLAVLPVSNLLPLPFLLFAPYRAAVASIGLAVLLAQLLGRLWAPVPGFRSAPAALAASALATWYALQTLEGIPSFRSEARLFSTVVEHDPDSVIARYMLARLALYSGQPGDAAEQLRYILTYLYGGTAWKDPRSAYDLLLHDRGVRMRAMQNQGTRGDPAHYVARLFEHLGFALMHSADVRGAISAYETARLWHPDEPSVNHGLGWCYAQTGDYSRAEQYLLAAASAAPNAELSQLLAQVYERQGRFAEARARWREGDTLRTTAGDTP